MYTCTHVGVDTSNKQHESIYTDSHSPFKSMVCTCIYKHACNTCINIFMYRIFTYTQAYMHTYMCLQCLAGTYATRAQLQCLDVSFLGFCMLARLHIYMCAHINGEISSHVDTLEDVICMYVYRICMYVCGKTRLHPY